LGWTVGGAASGANVTSLTGSSSGAAYVFNAGGGEDAIGILNSGSYTTGKQIAVTFTNDTASTIDTIDLSWNYEKYRTGTRAWDWAFTAGAIAQVSGSQSYLGDAANTTATFSPPGVINKSFTIAGLSIPSAGSYQLVWTLNGATGGSTNGQALGIDDFSLTAHAVPEPSTCAMFLVGICTIFGIGRSRATNVGG
jgi:PEP-CTERM motif